jgi:hypothetical protein
MPIAVTATAYMADGIGKLMSPNGNNVMNHPVPGEF